MPKPVEVGQVVPPFRLPSGQGPDVGPEDYRGRANVIVWFTKGMACAFCRQHMSQLVRGYPTFQALHTEILQVTPSTPERGRFYARGFAIPFPYLCDPDYSVRRSWGLEMRSHGVGWYARALLAGMRAPQPPSDFGKVPTSPREIPALLTDEDMGFYILDRNGFVRYRLAGSYVQDNGVRPIPGNDEITRELRRLEEAAGQPG
jgi:peroxiredoxin